jgi:3-oxoacyl-[acyl-carrier protein] reductase
VASEIAQRGGQSCCIPTDVSRRDDLEAVVAATLDAYGGLDIMIHNAFTDRARASHRLEDADDGLWDALSTTAMWASFWCTQVALPWIRASGRGRLVFVSSPSAMEGSANVPLYASVKAAQRALAKSLARELGPDGVTVNCIAPVALTPALESAFAANPVLEEQVRARSALGRVGDPEVDIGGVVVWLAGDGAGYVTGQTIVCDGGGFLGL